MNETIYSIIQRISVFKFPYMLSIPFPLKCRYEVYII